MRRPSKFTILDLLRRYRSFIEEASDSQFNFFLVLFVTLPVTLYYISCNLAFQWSFMTIACDTAAYQSALVNTLAGSFFRATAYGGPNMLGGHTSFSLLAAAPFYFFIPRPETLFVLQDVGICGAVIPLYWYAVERGLAPRYSFFICICYLINPLVLHMVFAPFHPECLIGATFIALLYAFQKNWSRLSWILIIFVLGCGEEAAPTLIALGLFLYFSRDELPWRTNYARRFLFSGILWLILAEFVFLPLFRNPELQTNVVSHYDNWNVKSDGDLPLAILSNPLMALSLLFSGLRWGYFSFLVGLPMLFIPCRPRTILILAPLPIFLLMSDREFFIYFHAYYFQFVLLSATVAMIQLLQRLQSSRIIQFTILTTLSINIFLTFLNSQYYTLLFQKKDDPYETGMLHQVFDSIPKNACVYAPHRYSVYLSARPDMIMGDLQDPSFPNFNFYTYAEGKYPSTQLHASKVDFIFCNIATDQCGPAASRYNRGESEKRLSASATC